MMAIFVPSFFSEMYCAEAEPWFGSMKHIWKVLALRSTSIVPVSGFCTPPSTSVEEADGVRQKMLSAEDSAEVATQGVEVTEPRKICIPQSFSVL